METIELVVGRIGKPHGIRGELTVNVRTDEPERRFADGTVLKVQAPKGSAFPHTSLTVVRTRWHLSTLLVVFAEFPDRTSAESARGVALLTEVPLDETSEDPDEFYEHQLVGLAVHDLDGTVIGEVKALTPGAQDLLTVRTPDGRDALVPFVSALVPEVDLVARRVVVADRPGLVTPLPED